MKRGSDGAEETVLLHVGWGVAEEQEGVTECGTWGPTAQGVSR